MPSPASSHTVSPFTRVYKADRFQLGLTDEWQDKTVFVITGPVTEGIQHNLTVNVDPGVTMDSLQDFTDWNVRTLLEELKGIRLLLQTKITLTNGLPAYRVVFSWFPTETLRIYQEQLYLLYEGTGYKVTASFTKKTRKTLGNLVHQMMLSFSPIIPQRAS